MPLPYSMLFIDDDEQLVAALVRQAENAGYRAGSAHNTLTALTLIEQSPPDLICLDVQMPTGSGLEVAQLLAADPRWSGIPLIVLSGRTDAATLRRCQQLGARHIPKASGSVWHQIEMAAVELLPADGGSAPPDSPQVFQPQVFPPQDPQPQAAQHLCISSGLRPMIDSAPPSPPASAQERLIETVFELLGADPDYLDEAPKPDADAKAPSPPSSAPKTRQSPISQPPPGEDSRWKESEPWVLCIEDDEDFSLALKLKLKARGISVVRANEGMQGIAQASCRPADAVILDFNLPNGQGDFVLRRLKSNPVTASIPVIVLTGVRDQSLAHRMMSLGAAKFLNKPVVWEELFHELEQHLGWLPASP